MLQQLPVWNPSSIQNEDTSVFAGEELFSSAACQRHGVTGTALKEYLDMARFILAEYKVYGPEEVVSLKDQKIEVVVRSTFAEPPKIATTDTDTEGQTSNIPSSNSNGNNDINNGSKVSTNASKTSPGRKAATPTTSSGPTTAATTPAIPEGAIFAADGTPLLRTYVTESATGQTVNHVRMAVFTCFTQ